MKRIFLNYLDKTVEASYKASALEMGYKLFIPIMLLIFFDIGTYAFPGVLATNNSKMIIITTGLLIALALLGLCLRKCITILRYYCAIILFLYMIIVVEVLCIHLYYTKNIDSISIIIMMISLNFGMNCIIYMNFSWIFFFFFNIFLYSYMVIRLFTIHDWEPQKYLKFLLITMVNGFISYHIEKNTRKNYLDLYKSNEVSKTFQHLIDEILPTPIIIRKIKESSICFYNHAIVQLWKKDINDNDEENLNAEKKNLLIKQILNEKIKSMKTSKEKNLIQMDLLSILDNFNEELIKEKELGSSTTFLHRSFFIPRSENESSHPIKDQNLNIYDLKEEEEKNFDIKIQKICWQNEECFMIILNDVTSSISLSKFKDINVYKNRLLATVSHDLRTPINGMMGMIETVTLNLNERQEDKKLLKMAMKFGHLLLSMINDILDFSMISNFQMSLNFEVIDLIALIKDVCHLIKFQIKNKGIDFIFEKVNLPENHLYISTDPNRLKQILLNLLSNSLKFTFRGHIKLILEMTDQDLLKIVVEDTGIGIRNENIPKLFTLFGKLQHEDPSINKQGVGLGLVISQNLAKLLDKGKDNGIHVESVWNEGSKFWFYISIFQKKERSEIEFARFDKINTIINFEANENILGNVEMVKIEKRISNESIHFINKKIKIMIVDDDQINLLVAKEYMKFFHLDYITANNGKEALEIINRNVVQEHQNIDAILMDCNMPIMDGFDASQQINEILKKYNLQPMPIIALTANVSSSDIEFCLQSGMNYFLSKPVSRKELSKTLGFILKIELPS